MHVNDSTRYIHINRSVRITVASKTNSICSSTDICSSNYFRIGSSMTKWLPIRIMRKPMIKRIRRPGGTQNEGLTEISKIIILHIVYSMLYTIYNIWPMFDIWLICKIWPIYNIFNSLHGIYLFHCVSSKYAYTNRKPLCLWPFFAYKCLILSLKMKTLTIIKAMLQASCLKTCLKLSCIRDDLP
jgi:hypothetical protein